MKTLISYITVTSLSASISLLSANVSAADEAALYELAPADSAYVRLINNASDKSIRTEIQEKVLLSDAYCKASAYEFVEAGDYAITVDDKNWSGQLKPNNTYTFVLNHDAIHVIEDAVFKNPKKGQFATYNLTDKETISVKTKDGKKSVFPKVSGNTHEAREVNPIKIGLAVYDAGNKLLEAGTARFQRGKSNNLFVCGSEKNYLASWSNQ